MSFYFFGEVDGTTTFVKSKVVTVPDGLSIIVSKVPPKELLPPWGL